MNLKKILFQGYPNAPHILIACWTEKIRIFLLIHCLNLTIGVNCCVSQTNLYLCIHCRFTWCLVADLCSRDSTLESIDVLWLKKNHAYSVCHALCLCKQKKFSSLSLLQIWIGQDPGVLPNFKDFLRTEGYKMVKCCISELNV